MSALKISYYIIYLANIKGYKISNYKLQKMLYCIQKEAIKNNEIAFNDKIEAWKIGPVVSEVYYRFSVYDPFPIEFDFLDISEDDIKISTNIQKYVDIIFEQYKDIDVWDMVDETHIPGNAWYLAYKRGFNYEIIIEDIKNELEINNS